MPPAFDDPAESFTGLVLQLRGRIGLTQRELAAQMGVHVHSIQGWEAGANFPGAASLRALIAAALRAGGFTAGHEVGRGGGAVGGCHARGAPPPDPVRPRLVRRASSAGRAPTDPGRSAETVVAARSSHRATASGGRATTVLGPSPGRRRVRGPRDRT